MINRVVLVGRLTKDPELRYTQSGAAVAQFTIAVNRQFTNSKGERDADFISCVIWRKAAENFTNFTYKGSLVGLDGRIQTSSYDNKQGQRVYRTDVIIEDFSLLESKSETSSKPADNSRQKPSNSNGYGNQPANNANQSADNSADPFADKSKPIDISDDDLPF
ncbi:MAG TPA: single-stranded DNA-binding protein [Lactobacillus sp.]|nr:single-stranded DNA-binding protein [Lactobacillus sp.]